MFSIFMTIWNEESKDMFLPALRDYSDKVLKSTNFLKKISIVVSIVHQDRLTPEIMGCEGS